MNKDAIYIEPEDDITDILTKIKEVKGETAALVPPKKAGVLRSAVNFKLMAKTAKEAGKTPVLISNDESLVKLAGTVGMQVAKNLQSEPVEAMGLKVTDGTKAGVEEEMIDGAEAVEIMETETAGAGGVAALAGGSGKVAAKAGGKKAVQIPGAPSEGAAEEFVSGESMMDEAGADKQNKGAKKALAGLAKYRKLIVVGLIALVAIIGFLIWALVFAPAATIAVTVRTTAKNFSENVSFTLDEGAEDAANGVFLLEQQELVKSAEVEFEATGEVDKGTKATGTVTLKRTSPVTEANAGAISVAKGTKFTLGDKSFVTTEAASLGAVNASNCATAGLFGNSCNITKDITAQVPVIAEFAGTSYNLAESATGWTGGNGYSVNSGAMTGGTSKVVKVVSEEDIKKAKEELEDMSESEGKQELLENFPSGLLPIEIKPSFAMEAGEPKSVPALDVEVKEGEMPVLSVETKFTMYGVDRARLEEFIEGRSLDLFVTGADPVKIYSTGLSADGTEDKVFIESFRELADKKGSFEARLKSTVLVGPEVTNEMVMERALGRKVGEVQSNLKSISGVSAVKVNTSFFWVTAVPNNINKVTVEITVE